MTTRIPARAIWALGVTQIIGYGTLYYSFSVLAPAIGQEFNWSSEWVYAALTIALLAGGFLAPYAGHVADRFGAARVMVLGSVAAAVTLVAAALSSTGIAYAAALVAMEIASSFVLYSTAFAALVQVGGQGAQRSITHLTLIAGFASTIFWPITSLLLEHMDWHGVYVVFAALNLLVCAPLHFCLGRAAKAQVEPVLDTGMTAAAVTDTLHGRHRSVGFVLMLFGFAIEGFILAAILMQIIPLLTGLGLGSNILLITTLFGPAQVLSRLANMVLGKNLLSTRLAIITAVLPPLAVAVVALTAPSLIGSILFAVLFGLGSGLTSIVAGALPLQLLGRENYGSRLGWLSSARQIASAVSPFCLAIVMGALGTTAALWLMTILGGIATLIFVTIAVLPRAQAAGANTSLTTAAG
ncbi:arsenite efflux MFS transporter ArsK [Devosia sp. ZB163]|uniref:arsenite efflux MFS transporter ArsK n=1 Tax=Devosia sp. ZB163 TaxID=3025938 RepID=UPI00235F59D0|nr:arsenite efflux MFS transporter ArsK [Devosia sp. ZB163]MDC9823973.1 arsenite efflux MFS transporter ArsK [Devosia sp. ZB163]